MNDIVHETKQLALHIKENEDKFISGELRLEETLDKTEKLYDCAFKATNTLSGTACEVLPDSSLMQLQSRIVQQRTKCYRPDTLIFDPISFSEKLKKKLCGITPTENKSKKNTQQFFSTFWERLGEESRNKLHTAPTFDFVYGTFQAEPASPVKKKRRRIVKDKIAEAVKPHTMSVAESSEAKDAMMSHASRIYNLLTKLVAKTKNHQICFYEFVIDPASFTRTIENIFAVSLLVQFGNACVSADKQGLPWLRPVADAERKSNLTDPKYRMQSVLSMSVTEWKAIIKKCNFKTALIPAKRST